MTDSFARDTVDREMTVGMDMQALRWVPAAGLYYHVWNLFDALRKIEGNARVIPFFYGHPALVEPPQVQRLRNDGLHRGLRHYWDGPSIPLLSSMFGRRLRNAPRFIQYIDRRFCYRVWRRLNRRRLPPTSENGARAPSNALRGITLFHHVELPLFPLSAFSVNVMTIPDLTTFRVPMFHQQHNVELVSDVREVAPRMDMLITESEHTKRDVVELLGVDADQVKVTPLAAHHQFQPVVDRVRQQRVLSKHGLCGVPYIINVGTLEPRKNHRRLIESFHRLKSNGQIPKHQLVLIGGKGWLYDEIFQTIGQLGLQSQVKWLGYVPFEDLPALISSSDVFVYPSLYEGFGLPPLEAMSCGAAVIASNTTSIPEVVGDAGILVDPTSSEDIAAAILRVIMDKALRNSLRTKALRRARTFTWERTARLTLAAYREARSHASRRKDAPLDDVPSRCRDNMRQWVLDELHQRYGQRGLPSTPNVDPTVNG